MFATSDRCVQLSEAVWHNLRVLRALPCHGLELFRYRTLINMSSFPSYEYEWIFLANIPAQRDVRRTFHSTTAILCPHAVFA